jgi:hypothetical protein
MVRTVDPDEAATVIADTDRLQMISIHLTQGLPNALRATGCPNSAEAKVWRRAANSSRIEAVRWSHKLQHPRRITAVRVDELYANAMHVVRNEHEAARQLGEDCVQARPPQPLPPTCELKLRDLLDVSGMDPTQLFRDD